MLTGIAEHLGCRLPIIQVTASRFNSTLKRLKRLWSKCYFTSTKLMFEDANNNRRGDKRPIRFYATHIPLHLDFLGYTWQYHELLLFSFEPENPWIRGYLVSDCGAWCIDHIHWKGHFTHQISIFWLAKLVKIWI